MKLSWPTATNKHENASIADSKSYKHFQFKKRLSEFFYNTLLLTVGSALCAVAVNGILIPHHFLSSGLTGIALIIFYKYPVLPVGVFYLLINIPVLLLGWLFISLRFVLYTAWGMIIYSLMLYTMNVDFGITDKLLGAIIAGGITGFGVAVMYRSYGSAGGSEIIFVILNRIFSLTLGTGSVIVNGIIMISSLFLFPLQSVLYTLVFITTSAVVTDKVFLGLAKRQAVLVISSKWQDIVNEMTSNNRLGVTLLKGKGGYLGTEETILYSIIKRENIHSLKKIVSSHDPNAFVAIMDAADVIGENVGNQPHW